MFYSLNLLFIFVLNEKTHFKYKVGARQGARRQPPLLCLELIEVKPCLKMGSTINFPNE